MGGSSCGPPLTASMCAVCGSRHPFGCMLVKAVAYQGSGMQKVYAAGSCYWQALRYGARPPDLDSVQTLIWTVSRLSIGSDARWAALPSASCSQSPMLYFPGVVCGTKNACVLDVAPHVLSTFTPTGPGTTSCSAAASVNTLRTTPTMATAVAFTPAVLALRRWTLRIAGHLPSTEVKSAARWLSRQQQ